MNSSNDPHGTTTSDADQTQRYDRAFPEEISNALDALGDEVARQCLADLHDTHLLETSQPEKRISALQSLVRAGLASKKIDSHTEDEINARYEISEYGKRFITNTFDTLGTIEPENIDETETE